MGDITPVHERAHEPRYQRIECLDCECLDTYGGADYAALGREHAAKTGHHVVMVRQQRIDLNPHEGRAPIGAANGSRGHAMTVERMCECENPNRGLFTWRGDPEWWSCEQCDGRVRPKTDAELRSQTGRGASDDS